MRLELILSVCGLEIKDWTWISQLAVKIKGCFTLNYFKKNRIPTHRRGELIIINLNFKDQILYLSQNDCSWDLPTVLWWVFQHTKTFLRAIRLSISYLDKRYANSSMTATGTFAQPCYKFETPHILLMNYKINVRL